jgi:signal recognition particle GTPase
LEAFKPKSFIGKMLGMGDISGLFETLSEAHMGEASKHMMKRMEQGE